MSKFPPVIPTKDLKLSDVPEVSAPWSGPDDTPPWRTIGRFALTFDRTEKDPYNLEIKGLADLPTGSSVTLLRAHLFFEQRRWNHYGRQPDEEALKAIRRVLALIREKLA